MTLRVLVLGSLFVLVGVARAANIAVIDSGLDYKHKDLVSNIWSNPNTPAETTDADGKIYKGDIRGWNFAENNEHIIDDKYRNRSCADCEKLFDVQSRVIDGSATEDDKKWYKEKKADKKFAKQMGVFGNFVHGTHVAGIAAMDAPKAKLIAMKLLPTEQPGIDFRRLSDYARDYEAQLTTHLETMGTSPIGGARKWMADLVMKKLLGMVAEAQPGLLITVGKYTAAVKADVANGSFGVSITAVETLIKPILKMVSFGAEPTAVEVRAYATYFLDKVLEGSKGFVDSSPNTLFVFAAGNEGTDNDKLASAPANLKRDNTISVAATLGTSALASFSNYGGEMVEVAAPGVMIRSTIPDDQYLSMSGTSMAAPYVTQVAGVIKDANPALTPIEIKQILMGTVDVKSWLAGKVKSSGIVNRRRAERAAELSKTGTVSDAIDEAKKVIADQPTGARSSINTRALYITPLPSFLRF